MPPDFQWDIANLTDEEHLGTALSNSGILLDSHPEAVIENDLSWVIATHSKPDSYPVAFFCNEGQSCIGYTLFLVHNSGLPLSVGEVSLGSIPIQQWTLHGGSLLKNSNEHTHVQLITGLFSTLRAKMVSRCALLAVGVPSNSTFFKMLQTRSAIHKKFHVMQYGHEHLRRFIALPATFEDYLRQLGPKTRADLNRTCRKLREHVGGATVLKSYTEPATIDDFMRQASLVSQKTYQWHLLKRGLRDHTVFRKRLEEAARRGWLRAYILFCRDQPVAFMVGYLHRGRYYSTDIGYDPDWAIWSVGNALHCEVVRDLIEKVNTARLFDFMGDRPTHQRLSNNISSREAAFYLFPKSLQGSLLYYTFHITDGFSVCAARILDRLNLKLRLRKLIRRLFASTQSP